MKEILRYYLDCRFDRRKSFYNKATVIVFDNGDKHLISYTTLVSKYDAKTGKVQHLGRWSQTTSRHQREFEKQCNS